MSGKLYVVGTPIGNLEDFSPRAVRILGEADFIAAEDTRVTLKLLNHFEIKKEMLSYYEHNKNAKGNLIIERILKGEKRTMIFYEAPHKLPATLRDMLIYLGDRKISLVRELTKIHETVMNTTLSKAAEYYTDNTPRGEFVLIIEGKKEEETAGYSFEDAVNLAKRLIKDGKSTSAAAKEAAEVSKYRKSEIYKELI